MKVHVYKKYDYFGSSNIDRKENIRSETHCMMLSRKATFTPYEHMLGRASIGMRGAPELNDTIYAFSLVS